jgi:hypothetical protein
VGKAVWVHVPGPGGTDTTVQLSPDWLAAVKAKAGSRWSVDYTKVLVKVAARNLLKRGYDALLDGAYSAAVRRGAYELAAPRRLLTARAAG